MEDTPKTQTICDEIAEEVRDMAINLHLGRLKPELFARALRVLEEAKLKRFGFHLEAETETNGGVHFRLFAEDAPQPCATLDFDGPTQMLEIHQICG